jgi:hypothetical protein
MHLFRLCRFATHRCDGFSESVAQHQ